MMPSKRKSKNVFTKDELLINNEKKIVCRCVFDVLAVAVLVFVANTQQLLTHFVCVYVFGLQGCNVSLD